MRRARWPVETLHRFRQHPRRSIAPARSPRTLCALGGAFILAACAIPAFAAAPSFAESGTINSDAGYALLKWEAKGPVTLEMAQRTDFQDARPLYQGPNQSSFISGLADGDYYLRLRNKAGEESPALRLSVSHHPLSQALWLAALGAVIFLAVVVTILRGARDD